MIRAFLPLLLVAAAQPAEFEPVQSFADAAACRAHLEGLVEQARRQGVDAVEGPYTIAAGDVRIHMVRAEADGHRIDEHRCLGAELSARSWRHTMKRGDADAPFTIESVARSAEWLKKGGKEE